MGGDDGELNRHKDEESRAAHRGRQHKAIELTVGDWVGDCFGIVDGAIDTYTYI